MSEGPAKRRWLRWSLRTLFLVLTAGCIWLGYYAHWKNERRQARVWLGMQLIGGGIGFQAKPASAFPWMLGLLGDERTDLILMRHEPSDNLGGPAPEEYRALVRRIESLFPEAVVLDATSGTIDSDRQEAE